MIFVTIVAGEGENGDTRFRLAAECAGLGIWEYRPDSGQFDCDEGARLLLGLEPGAVCGTLEGFLACVHAEDRESVRRRFALAVDPRDPQPCLAEFRCQLPAALSRWISARGRATSRGTGSSALLLGTLDDITARKQVEDDRERMVGELSRVVQSSELLLGILGHDLRNPLGAIVTTSELLMRRAAAGSENESARHHLERINSSAHRMARMIEQLLDFTRIRFAGGIPLNTSGADLIAVATEVSDEISQMHAGVEVRLQQQGDTRGIWDADRLAQMLSNLLGNAVEHGTAGCAIHLRVDGTDPNWIRIDVQNDGSMPEDVRARIFDPFQVGHQRPRTMGLGLGLYVVRQIVLAHGGDIEVRASDGNTTFRVRLPRVAKLGIAGSAGEIERAEREMVALEQFASRSPATAVTAQLFGAAALPDRAPRDYWSLLERYSALLDLALERQTYRSGGEKISEDIRSIAERLGALGASAREVAELHARAIRKRTRTARSGKVHAVIAEGRMLAFELMGHVLSYYRRRAVGEPVRETPGGGAGASS